MILREWDLSPITAAMVLRAEGADPEVIQRRRPQLARLADQALREAAPLLTPVLIAQEVPASALFESERDCLAEGASIEVPWARPLAHAETLQVMAGTVGAALEARVAALMQEDPAFALALDAVGTVAIDLLRHAALQCCAGVAAARRMQVTRSLSPGIAGWPLAQGQRQIFARLNADELREGGVERLRDSQLKPRKSFSLVVGMGAEVEPDRGSLCEECSLRGSCAYKARYLIETLV